MTNNLRELLMKKKLKIILISCASIITILGVTIPILPFMLGFKPAYGVPSFDFPFENPDDIVHLSAYHTPNWGEPGVFHNGIDLVIEHSSIVISPCYGIVSRIWYNVNPYVEGEVAMIHVQITVNYGWKVKLVFEPWANTSLIREEQLAAIIVKIGTKVQPGAVIGTLLFNHHYPHLHYMVLRNEHDVCPYHHSSLMAQSIFEEIATRTNSIICYC